MSCKHSPDLHTVHRDAGAPDFVLDVNCQHCGRSGSLVLNLDEVLWGDEAPPAPGELHCDKCGQPMVRKPEKDKPIMWPGAARFRCKTCGEEVEKGAVGVETLREHLEGHHPAAANLEPEQVRDAFEYVGEGPKVEEGVYEAYECANGHILLEPFD